MVTDPALEVNRDWIDRLGVDGHSGDESDHLPTQSRYAIMNVPWRSGDCKKYLRALDLVHLDKRFDYNGRPTKGAWPRTRVISRRSGDGPSKPVRGLPRNFYDASWLAAQSPETVRSLRILDTTVDLSIPPSVQR